MASDTSINNNSDSGADKEKDVFREHLLVSVNYWYYEKKVNVIPTKKDKTPNIESWVKFKTERIPKELFEGWKEQGLFDNGFGIMLGRTYSLSNENLYLIGIDCDKPQAIKELSTFDGEFITLQTWSSKFRVERHEDDLNSLHIYLFSPIPFPTKGADTKLGLEVKGSAEGSGYMIGSPTLHPDGFSWKVLGTHEPAILNKEGAFYFMTHIDNICRKYGLEYLEKKSGLLNPELKRMIRGLKIKKDANLIINEGGRHAALVSIASSILFHHMLKDESNLDELKQFFEKVNRALCKPGPLPKVEMNSIWNSSVKYVRSHKDFTVNNNLNQIQSENKLEQKGANKQELFEKIPNKKLIEYVVGTAQKTIKQENSLVRLLFYTGLSTYTKNPLNLGIIAPTSEGKTYPVTEMTKLFPVHDVWTIGSMSPKVIIRDRGILVDENNEPIEQMVQELVENVKKAQESGDKEEESDLNRQLKEIHKNSKVLIDLSGKVLVFLEPPHKETWDILKPILSHDTFEIEHPYVYKTETKGMEVKHIVTRGWPACIFCSAKDESNWPTWPEIQSRFFITSPNMVRQKYRESTMLIGQRLGLPSLVQEQLIISPDEIQLAKDCLLVIKDELLNSYDDGVWIPYQKMLSLSLPSEKGTDVRIAHRVFSLLKIITESNSFGRSKLKFGKETMSISSLEDLREVLQLTQNITGIPSYKLDFFRNVFIPLFQSKKIPEAKEDGSIKEDKVAVYTSELADSYKERKGKSITVDAIKKTYLEELRNNGLIDEFESKIDRRRKGYYPIVDASLFQQDKYKNYTNSDDLDNNLQYLKLNLPKNFKLGTENWLKIEILELLNYGIGKTDMFQLVDFEEDDEEICLCRFIKKYEQNLALKDFFQLSSDDKSPGIFGRLVQLENNPSPNLPMQLNSSNDQVDADIASDIASPPLTSPNKGDTYIENIKNQLNSSDSIQAIEEFFTETYFEDGTKITSTSMGIYPDKSPCKQLIGKEERFGFYYCKLHPEVENVNFAEIEHHVRYKEPEIHKKRLIEIIEKDELKKI